MQYSVPQFVDVEDKIIGPLTLKQFLILLAGGLVEFFYYSLFKMGILFFLLTLPTAIFFVYLSFGKFNGRPVLSNMGSVIKFMKTPKYRVFEKTGEQSLPINKKVVEKSTQKEAARGNVGSQLKRLAYILDQKTAEEERIIHSGEIEKKWLNQI